MYHSQGCGKFFKNALLSVLNDCNLKDQIQTAIEKTDQPLLQNVWHKIKYHPDVCRATNGANTENLFELLFTMV
jgi:hypothetical protein